MLSTIFRKYVLVNCATRRACAFCDGTHNISRHHLAPGRRRFRGFFPRGVPWRLVKCHIVTSNRVPQLRESCCAPPLPMAQYIYPLFPRYNTSSSHGTIPPLSMVQYLLFPRYNTSQNRAIPWCHPRCACGGHPTAPRWVTPESQSTFLRRMSNPRRRRGDACSTGFLTSYLSPFFPAV